MTYVTKQQLAKHLDLHATTVMRWVREGILPPPLKAGGKPGSHCRFVLEDCERRLAESQVSDNSIIAGQDAGEIGASAAS